jgi:hypothetical protein
VLARLLGVASDSLPQTTSEHKYYIMRFNEILSESAVKDLAKELPNLKKHDYDTIDQLMRRISRRYKITGKKLHDLFVSKYGHTPDHWIKKYKDKLGEEETDESLLSFMSPGITQPKKKIDYDAVRRYSQQNDSPEKQYFIGKDSYEAHKKEQARLTKEKELKQYVRPKAWPSGVAESVQGKDQVQMVNNFIDWTIRRLHIKQPYPQITLSRDTQQAQEGHHTGRHTSDGKIWVYIENRNMVDIFRTIFHELVHHRQDQLNMIGPDDSYPGSPVEAMADMMAGKYIKIYGKNHPEIFQ